MFRDILDCDDAHQNISSGHTRDVPPEAHFTKALTYVDCYAYHPGTRKLKRKRYKLNRVRGAAARKAAARDLVEKLSQKLRQGWNPWTEAGPLTSVRTLRVALVDWCEEKKRTRFSSPHNYLMQARMFEQWCSDHTMLDQPPSAFTREHATKYMNHIAVERKVNNTTYNGYLNIIRGFFHWCERRDLVTDNPFKLIQRKRKVQKFRTILTAEERTAALEWFRKNDPPMVTVCLLVFHTLIRPRNELSRLRVGDIDLVKGEIRFKAEQTKTLSDRHPAIPPHMVAMLLKSPIAKSPPDFYAVGDGLLPSREPMNLNMPATRWSAMRRALGWSADKQLMSLRDSGIVQLIRDGVPLESVMKQADHKSLATTNTYVQHAHPHAQEEVRRRASHF